MTFNCYYCKIDKPLEICKNNTHNPNTNRGKCLPCARDNAKNAIMTKKAEANPANYMGCDGCDRVFNKFSSQRKPRKVCPFCKSSNIVPY